MKVDGSRVYAPILYMYIIDGIEFEIDFFQKQQEEVSIYLKIDKSSRTFSVKESDLKG